MLGGAEVAGGVWWRNEGESRRVGSSKAVSGEAVKQSQSPRMSPPTVTHLERV